MSDRPLETAQDGDELGSWRGAAWLRRAFLAERDRWILWLPVGLGIGVALYFNLESEPPVAAGPGLVAILVLVAWWRRGSSIATRLAVFSVVSIALGFSLAQVRTVWVAAPIVDREHGPAWVSGQLLEVEPRPVGHRIVIAVDGIEDLASEAIPHRVRLSLRTKGVEPVPGTAIRVRAVLLPPPEPAAPGAFDFARTLFFKRIGAVGYAVGGLELGDGGTGVSGNVLGEQIAAIRLAVATRITDALRPEDARRGEGRGDGTSDRAARAFVGRDLERAA